MILQSRHPKVDYQQTTLRLQLGAKSEKEVAFRIAGLTFHESTDHGLSALCLKYLLGFSQIDISWFPKAVGFCIVFTN